MSRQQPAPAAAVAAFVARRGELRLTQVQLAEKAGVSPRTLQNFENACRWPLASIRARLEQAVGWPPGEIYRLSQPPSSYVDPPLLDRLSELSADQKLFLAGWLRESAIAGEDRVA